MNSRIPFRLFAPKQLHATLTESRAASSPHPQYLAPLTIFLRAVHDFLSMCLSVLFSGTRPPSKQLLQCSSLWLQRFASPCSYADPYFIDARFAWRYFPDLRVLSLAPRRTEPQAPVRKQPPRTGTAPPLPLAQAASSRFPGFKSRRVVETSSRPRKGQRQDGELNSPPQGPCCVRCCGCSSRRRAPRSRGQ
jgi:hypothetical protein